MYGETVTRIRRQKTGEDRDNEPIYSDTETAVSGAGVAWGPSEEPLLIAGNPVTVDATLYFWESSPDIKREDRIRVRGKVYEVAGDPADWRNPFTGWNAGLVVNLVRGEGS